MSIHCLLDRSILLEALSSMQNISNKKSNLAVLSNILFESQENSIVLTATDLEIGLRLTIPCEIYTSGQITLPSKKIFEIVRESGSQSIIIQENERSWVTINAGLSTYNLAGIEASEYPDFPENEDENFVLIQTNEILDLIDKVIFSIASEQENIYSLTSVLFEKEKRDEISLLRMVSSDGHRLSIIEKVVLADIGPLNFDERILIPRKGIHELKKFCEGRDSIEILIQNKYLFIKDNNALMVIRLKKGEFPAYRSIVQTVSMENCLHIPRIQFLESLKRIDLFTEDIFHTVQMKIEKERMILSSQNADIGNAKDELAINYSGEELLLGFNCRYFIDTLQVMECDFVEMYINSNTSPCLLQSVADIGFISVIMPMQL